MPVDKSKSSKPPPTRRPKDSEPAPAPPPAPRGFTHARELEVKRSRGEVSCAECRRLKIKCNKVVPCSSCVRRGCGALCPNGALSTGQGTRFVLAATEHLHRKISRMSERIRALEDALSTAHAAQGGPDRPVHPLLTASEDFSLPGEPLTARRAVPEEGNPPSNTGDVIDAFGTLSISDHGISRFFGLTGGSESLLIANAPSPSASVSTSGSPSSLSLSRSSQSLSPASTHASPKSPPSQTPTDPSSSPVALFSQSAFPLNPLGPPQAIHTLVTSHLPPRNRARLLVDSYFAQMAWLFRGVTRGQVYDMLGSVYASYGRPEEQDEDYWRSDQEEIREDTEDYTGPHDLALLFMVFAVGALVQPPSGSPVTVVPAEDDDAHRKRCSAEGEHLHQIARAALALQPVLEKPSIVTIQTLHVLSIYNSMAVGPNDKDDTETSMEMTWSLITLASHLSQTIGLHRDSVRWGLSPKIVQRRRILFWDLFVADVWNSLNTGRPPSFSLAYIDCEFPEYEGAKAKDGAVEVWNFRFAAECVADVTARTLTADTPSYTTIMELDKKVREFPLPPVDQSSLDASSDDVGASMLHCVHDHIRETVLMYIHRSFFAQAIIEDPVNPLKSAYAPSFLAAYRASATILKSIREQFALMPNVCARYWTMWTFAFSAAVVFGTVVTRGPRSLLAGSAMTELEQACLLFSKAATYSRRAAKALPILTRLNDKARHALANAQSDPLVDKGLQWNMKGVVGSVQVKTEECDDELSIFAGHTRLVSGQLQRSSTMQFMPPPPSHHMHTDDVPVYDPPAQQYPDAYPQPPRQSLPSSSNMRPVDARWDGHRYPPEERMSDEFYAPDGGRMPHNIPPPPSAPYAWPVDGFEGQHSHHPPPPPQHQPQYTMPQQHPYNYPYPEHSHPSYHAHSSELAQLGLAARDSRLDERWTHFMEDSGLLEGSDFRTR
ncbi:Zn(2)-C6 fungal-type domain-containing protein [Mycena chlorophos]|uniref:Zn(2)-C6 fungal-type domain-containing protein n=1 Tax=Mycena chlorophos TaxID=658473 RepID=A0A8H6WES1_MYCCL|nr:Zn(2)-C6 fungal-type domain-containing protein [Mycena chlorophos]